MTHMLHIKHYPAEHYSTLFNPDTGFFARVEDQGYAEPLWSQHGPELLDISITGWCDRLCQVCYRNASPRAKHMEYADYQNLIAQAAKIGVMQVALGGGNPNQHPEFVRILEMTRKEYGIVPSYTTSGRGLSPPIVKASEELCGAVAVSAYWPYDDLWHAVQTLIWAGVRTNVHFVLDASSIETAIFWLREPPGILQRVNAIVFLNYKPVGRQIAGVSALRNSERLEEFFSLIEQAEHPFRIGFDSCMVSGVASHTSIDASMYDACEAARFSMFISESMMMYPCSFMEATTKGVSAKENDLLDGWLNSETFCKFRDSLLKEHCVACAHSRVCMGGCPLFEEVNLCQERPPSAPR